MHLFCSFIWIGLRALVKIDAPGSKNWPIMYKFLAKLKISKTLPQTLIMANRAEEYAEV